MGQPVHHIETDLTHVENSDSFHTLIQNTGSWTIAMRAQERVRRIKAGANYMDFEGKAFRSAELYPDLAGSAASLQQWREDRVLLNIAEEYLSQARQLETRLSDTVLQLRTQVVKKALSYYHLLEDESNNDVQGARSEYETLSPSFAAYGHRNQDEEEEPENPEPENPEPENPEPENPVVNNPNS